MSVVPPSPDRHPPVTPLVRELVAWSRDHAPQVHAFMARVLALGRPFLLRSDLLDVLHACAAEDGVSLAETPLDRAVRCAQEAACVGGEVRIALRPRIGQWEHVRCIADVGAIDTVGVVEYLDFKDSAVLGHPPDPWTPTIDLAPFAQDFPRMSETRSIGRGAEFLNRTLASMLAREDGRTARRLFEFLRVHSVDGQQLMISDRLKTAPELRAAVTNALERLEAYASDTTWEELAGDLRAIGLEPGWGRTCAEVREMLLLLAQIHEAADPQAVEDFLGRVPMIFSVLIVTPHGWFAQAGVLGRPDTGGQVVYILDQVRALEEEMRRRLRRQGVDIEPKVLIVTRLIPEADGTTCDQRVEPVAGTDGAYILRVPFRDVDGEALPHWISRFEVWPWLERYAEEVEREVLAELGGRPDLIVGNYSDGNLVATLLAKRMGVTQCAIAHALEKSKYVLSDLYWQEHEEQHHFAAQFTADLIAMNSADIVVASTYQEIAGTQDTVGQYESHAAFTLPGLYRVEHGVDVYDPRFNIVSPGADPRVFYPPDEREWRTRTLQPTLVELIDGGELPKRGTRGRLADPTKPLIFSMARLDHVKNLTGLVEWFARCERLRELANVVIVSGHVDVERSGDQEEREQILRMHGLFEEHGLEDQVRWVSGPVDKAVGAELYRLVADRRGVFVQPALFEAFGLTVIEAMVCGLPTFATRYGGPLEILEDGVSGFHLDPNRGDQAAERIADFFEEVQARPERWEEVSRAGIERVRARYTWELYAERLMTFARTYGFWRFMTERERADARRYLELFYALQFRPLAAGVGT